MPNSRRLFTCSVSSAGVSKRRSSTSQCGSGSTSTCVRPASISGCDRTNKVRKSTGSAKTACVKKVVAKPKPKAVAAAKKATKAKMSNKKATSTASSNCRPCETPTRGRKSRCYSSSESSYSSFSSDDCFFCSCSECDD